MLSYDNAPIIACSSGNTKSAISVIRISGFDYLHSINEFFSLDIEKLEANKATFTKIIDQNKCLDEVVVTFFKGPKSYNKEDILEISAHGNPLNIKRIIELLKSKSHLRDAHPGEFSLRALEKGKLSLNQIEGLDLLLNADSVFSLDQGLSLLGGDLNNLFNELYDSYLNHRSTLELGFDFLEDIGEEQFREKFKLSFERLKITIEKLYKHTKNSSLNLLKPEIALVGLPNAGKSSLFNKILGSERSIVSDIAGTTRDFISESIVIDNNTFKLIDTAGIRESSDLIEAEGVKRSLEVLEKSFFKILIINPSKFDKNFYERLKGVQFDLIIFGHCDVDDFSKNFQENAFNILNEIGPIEPADFGPIEPLISKSIKLNILDVSFNQISKIENYILSKYLKLLSFDPVLLDRHIKTINNIYEEFCEYEKFSQKSDLDISILASELNILGHCISELIGIVSPDDVLHNIFDNFCIGK